ncbi:MAG: hypothetical protein EOP14_00100 [Pseudomonas sp.]|nr:MAG: hypothetical protein EOP14_00100 [Pseudomonas sp.]
MTGRERFEAWAVSRDYWISIIQDDVGYKSPATRVAFEAWQESRRQALEEALGACDSVYATGCDNSDELRGAAMCWSAVNDLTNPEGKQG